MTGWFLFEVVARHIIVAFHIWLAFQMRLHTARVIPFAVEQDAKLTNPKLQEIWGKFHVGSRRLAYFSFWLQIIGIVLIILTPSVVLQTGFFAVGSPALVIYFNYYPYRQDMLKAQDLLRVAKEVVGKGDFEGFYAGPHWGRREALLALEKKGLIEEVGGFRLTEAGKQMKQVVGLRSESNG